jgi:hypothetical protein
MAISRAKTELAGTGYNLDIKTFEDECKPDTVLKNFINFYAMRVSLIGVLGPGKWN